MARRSHVTHHALRRLSFSGSLEERPSSYAASFLDSGTPHGTLTRSRGGCDFARISRFSHRVLSLLPFFRGFVVASAAGIGLERSPNCCVVLRSRFIGAMSKYVYDPLIHAQELPPSKSLPHAPRSLNLGLPIVTTPSLCSPSAFLALVLIVCPYHFSLPLLPSVM